VDEALFLAAPIAVLDGSGTVSQRWRTEPPSFGGRGSGVMAGVVRAD
jgi:hypothetical protein